MVRTQIQMPEMLYEQAKALATTREISLAELVRNGLEYMLRVSAPSTPKRKEWKLPGPFKLGANDSFFDNPNWRYDLHMAHVEEPYIKAKSLKQVVGRKKST